MSTTSKSPRRVTAVALSIGKATLPRYGHKFSRHDFTLPQLFTCLVLRKFFNADYRGIVAILADWPTLQHDLGLPGASDAGPALMGNPSVQPVWCWVRPAG